MTLIMQSPDNKFQYQIDEILEEAQRKKQERQKQQQPKPAELPKEKLQGAEIRPGSLRGQIQDDRTDTVRKEPAFSVVSKPATAAAASPVTAAKETSVQMPVTAVKKTRLDNPFFKPSTLPSPVGSEASDDSYGKKPSEQQAVPQNTVKPADDVKVYIPKSPKTPLKEKDTIVLDKPAAKAVNKIPNETADDLEQIQIDSLLETTQNEKSAETAAKVVPIKKQPEVPETDTDWKEQLKLKRKKKAENFQIQEPNSFKISGEEEVNDPGEEPEVFEDEELEDFSSYEETETVRSELTYRRRIGSVKLFLTGLLTLALIGLMACQYVLKLNVLVLNPVFYIGLNVFLLGTISLLNHRIFGDGLSALFHFRATTESAAGLAALLALLHALLQLLNLAGLTGAPIFVLTPAAALGMFFSALGKQMQLKRICLNFQFISYRGDKYAVKLVDNERMAAEIGRSAVEIGVPLVCYLEKTQFLSHFLEHSYSKDTGDRVMRRFIPFVFFGSVVVALIYGVFMRDIMKALTIFASTVCISAPMGMASAVSFPILRSAKRALRHGAMLSGPQTVEEFGEIHALAVDALDLFPSEDILLHGIKTFSGSRIDEAIMDAAAVSIAAGGPLSSVFRRVIQDRVAILKPVDTLVYEQDMGMSGWVGGRRVLVGNRKLLENHGVDVPSSDYESRYRKDDRELVYLSTAGELSAMFVVSYTADDGIASALNALTKAGITLLVRTCDPNITEEMICSRFDLDSYYVEVMGASAGRCYEKLTSEESEESDAILASNGRLEGAAYGVTYCRRLQRAIRMSVAAQVTGGALGFALCALVSLCTAISLSPLFILGYSALWLFISWITACIYRV